MRNCVHVRNTAKLPERNVFILAAQEEMIFYSKKNCGETYMQNDDVIYVSSFGREVTY